MPKIFVSSTSPYSCKVRMAAAHLGLDVEAVAIDTAKPTEEFLKANPLGKIPTFVSDDGDVVFDSRAITQYLNRQSGNKLFPRNPAKRLEAERLEALADGICDCALAYTYELRLRPEEKIHQPWLDRQWIKVARALDMLNAEPPKLGSKIHAGHIALRAALGYLELRFAGKWEKGRSRLTRWMARFDAKFPDLKAMVPG
jgi:glutathione S-transferase